MSSPARSAVPASAPVATPAPDAAPVVTPVAVTRPAAPASSRPGKRAARPEPKRARSTRTLAPARTSPARPAPARVSRAAVEQAPTVAARPAAPAGPVRVAAPTTEILSPTTGKRRAVRTSSGTRSALLKRLPSAPILAGVAALAVSTGGAMTVAGPTVADSSHSASADLTAVSSISGSDSEILAERTEVVSRDSNRVEAQKASEAKLVAQAEKAAAQRSKTLETITVQAERQADKIEANQWVMPVEGYRLSATYGSVSGLWASSHTGLDFAAPAGTPLRAVANGTITEVGYDGSYGNKTVLTLEDGTEIWYCHQTSMHVSVGDQVVGGETIGTVGSTGNSTGPHLHLEVRPGGADHVNPYSALLEHGLRP